MTDNQFLAKFREKVYSYYKVGEPAHVLCGMKFYDKLFKAMEQMTVVNWRLAGWKGGVLFKGIQCIPEPNVKTDKFIVCLK